MKNNKGFALITIIIAVVAVLAISGIAYYAGTKSSTPAVQNIEEDNFPSASQNVTNNPPQISTASCNPSSAPGIKVLSPNGGGSFEAGQSINVTWESCNESRDINITLVHISSGSPVTLSNYSHTNDGSENIIIPQSIISGNYKIHIQVSTNSEEPFQIDTSDSSFSIVGIAPSCNNGTDPYSVTVLSPNGGEVLSSNQSMTVTWTSCNIPQNVLMQPILVKANNEEYVASLYATTDDGNLKNDGVELYTFSQPVPPGQYRVQMNIHMQASGTLVEGVVRDLSDAPFTLQ